MRQASHHEFKKAVSDFVYFCERFVKIVDKEQRTIPFRLNDLQLRLAKKLLKAKRARWDILKYRQKGITTFLCIFCLWRVLTKPNFKGQHYLHRYPPVLELKRKYQIAYNHLPDNFKNTKTDKILKDHVEIPDLNSVVRFATAGTGEGAGVSETINFLHFSEPPLYERGMSNILAAAGEAVPKGDFSYIILESTPRSIADDFAKHYFAAKDGINDYEAIFFPWYIDPEFIITDEMMKNMSDRDKKFLSQEQDDEEIKTVKKYGLSTEQLRWRRMMIRSMITESPAQGMRKFKTQYPESEEDCFLSDQFAFFPTDAVMEHDARIKIETREGKLKPKTGYEFFTEPELKRICKDVVIFYPSEEGKRYSFGADTSEGVDKGDFQAMVGLESEEGEQVCQFNKRVSMRNFSEILNATCRYYNEATLSVELNNHGHTVLEYLREEYRYPNLYRSRSKRRKSQAGQSPYTTRYGFYTQEDDKRFIMDMLADRLVRGNVLPNDPTVIKQLLYYEERNRKLGAPEGMFDDLVVALALADNGRSYSTSTIEILPFRRW